MRIAITGSTGFVGRHLVSELVRRGHEVSALERTTARAAALPNKGVTPVAGDVFDREAMARLADGADAFIHLIGIRAERQGGVTFQRLHVEATARALEAAKGAGVDRFLHMSALGTRPEARSAYHKTKFQAEQLVRTSGLDWTIFRPSIVLGEDGEFLQMARGWARGSEPPGFFLPYFTPFEGPFPKDPTSVQPVHVDDVADAFAASLETPQAIGEIYALGGPDAVTWPEMLEAVRDATPDANPSMLPGGVPEPVARMAAMGAGMVGMGAMLPFSESDVLMATEDNTCEIGKARAHLGFDPLPLADALATDQPASV